VIFGALYTLVNAATFFGAPLFYQFIVCVEIVLSVSIVVSALTWPKTVTLQADGKVALQ
jgi:hypothetical protein